jgi:hypothetical protein
VMLWCWVEGAAGSGAINTKRVLRSMSLLRRGLGARPLGKERFGGVAAAVDWCVNPRARHWLMFWFYGVLRTQIECIIRVVLISRVCLCIRIFLSMLPNKSATGIFKSVNWFSTSVALF